MSYWLHGKIEREEDNRSQIKDIKENIEKVRMASAQCNLMDLLDETTKIDVEKFSAKIDKILSDIILKGLRSIETFMIFDNFADAEQGIENISSVQRNLIGICTSQEVIKKTEELKEKLINIVTKILESNDFANIDKYMERPPKDLLARLKQVSVYAPHYHKAYIVLSGKLKQTFSQAIDQVHSVPMKERPAKLRSLNFALCFVPDELQGPFKAHIDEMNRTINHEEQAYERELDISLKSADENDHTITKIGALAKRFQEEGMDEFSEKLHEDVLKRFQLYRTNLRASLDENDMQSALLIMEKIIKYKGSIFSYIPQIKEIYETTRNSTIKSFENCSKIPSRDIED